VVYGGAEVGRFLVYHPQVDDVHITGSDLTHDLIVWGPPGAERERRKREANGGSMPTDQADLLSGYLNGEAVDDQDLVAWYALHAYHEIRSEDQPYMPVEWVGFEARPRDYFDKNPMN